MSGDNRPSAYILTGGALLMDGASALTYGLAIQIAGDRIAAISDVAEMPAHLPRLDVGGRTIVPGLIDAHVHSEDWQAQLYLAHGITTVRDTGCALEPVLDRRRRWNTDDALAPRLVCCGPLIDGGGSFHTAMLEIVRTPDEGRAAVERLVEAGVDQLKLYVTVERPVFEAVVAHAARLGIRTLGHMQNMVDAATAIRAGLSEIQHCSGCAEAMYPERALSGETWRAIFADIEPARMDRLIDLLLERRTTMTVTRVIWQKIGTAWDPRHWDHPQLRYTPARLQAWWRSRDASHYQPRDRLEWSKALAAMQLFTARLIEREVDIVAGSDPPCFHVMPGFGLHEELQLLLDCGMTPAGAIAAATVRAAAALQVDHDRGTITPGLRADLIVVDGNPLVDIRALQRIWRVIRGGRLIDPAPLLTQAAEYVETAPLSKERRFSDAY